MVWSYQRDESMKVECWVNMRKELQLKVLIILKNFFIPEQKFESNMTVESNKVMKMWSWDTEGQTDTSYEQLNVIGLG